MKKGQNLLFTNKYHALRYILHNLRKKYKRCVLPSIIGRHEIESFSDHFSDLVYYDYTECSPDYLYIRKIIDDKTILFLKDVYPCKNNVFYNDVFNNCGLVIKENNYFWNTDDNDNAGNILTMGDIHFLQRYYFGVFVRDGENLLKDEYKNMPKAKEPFLFRISSSLYGFLNRSGGMVDMIDEHIEKMKKSSLPRLSNYMEKRAMAINESSLYDNFLRTSKKIFTNVKNAHFKILFCEKYVYFALIIFVRDKQDLFVYLNNNGIKPVNYFEDDSPANENGEEFNKSLLFVGLSDYLGKEEETDKLIDALNRW